jgi:hemerythrin-like metal-binding protein
MALFEWDDQIALGIPAIDRQHQVLFGWINSLSDAVTQGDVHAKVEEMIINLITYVDVHFSEEERLLSACNYPGLPEHRKEHDRFVSHVREMQAGFASGNKIGEGVLNFLVEWLVDHIIGTDHRYKQYVSQEGTVGVNAPQ